MADFCKQCSIEIFGEDSKDLANLRKETLLEGYGLLVLCEGCGFTMVDNDGKCILVKCPKHGTISSAETL